MDDTTSLIAALAGISTVFTAVLALLTYLGLHLRSVVLDTCLLEGGKDEQPSIIVRVTNKSSVELEITAAYFGIGSEEQSNPIELYEEENASKRKQTRYLEGSVVLPGRTVSGQVVRNISPLQASNVLINEGVGHTREDLLEDCGDLEDDTKPRIIVIETTRGTRRKKLHPDMVNELSQETNEEFLDRAFHG